jgi:hypothetical protein
MWPTTQQEEGGIILIGALNGHNIHLPRPPLLLPRPPTMILTRSVTHDPPGWASRVIMITWRGGVRWGWGRRPRLPAAIVVVVTAKNIEESAVWSVSLDLSLIINRDFH